MPHACHTASQTVVVKNTYMLNSECSPCTFTKQSFRICPIYLSELTVSSFSILLCIHHKTKTNVYITELNAMCKFWISYSAMCVTFCVFVSV